MSRTVLLFVACVALCSSLSWAAMLADADYEREFTAWMHTHVKSYTASEFAPRFAKFKANLDFCNEFNTRNASFTVGVNVFADMDVNEFKSILLRPFSDVHTRNLDNVPEFTGEGVKVPRGTSLDWRTSGAVAAIKNQGQCGSCWTFSASAAIESLYKISTGTLPSLSEQNLLDCVTQSNGCDGGSYMAAFSYVASNGGIDTMASYPYESAKGSCRYNAANRGANINSYSRVTANDEGALLAAVAQQPVSVGIEADLQTFQNYRSGTYADSGCTAAGIDHAVLAIGYGTDASGVDYWLLKNSWGTGWGNQGFMQMKRGVNMCGIAAQAAFPTRTSTSSTTGSATTGATTAKPSTTGSSSTTGGSRSGNVFIDSLASGWTLGYYGTESGLSTTAAGQSGYAVTITLGANSALAFVSNPALPTTAYTTLKFSVKSTGTTLAYSVGSNSVAISGLSSSVWRSVSASLSSLGSPSSVSGVSIMNPSSSSVTITVDNVMFA